MPNSFLAIDVPTADGPGVPLVTSLTGSSKTFVLSGPVRLGGRYVIEGSNDDGATWDILVGSDGTQALFMSRNAGAKTIDAVTQQIRVRSIGNGPNVVAPPSITMGALPALGRNVFGALDVPPALGLGAPLDLGFNTGTLKTISLRGKIPPGSRYTVLASMDGEQFDEVMLFTGDQEGARAKQVMCRFLRVLRVAQGPTPVVTVGAEGLFEPGAGDGGRTPLELAIASDRAYETTSEVAEEVFAEYVVPFSALNAATLTLDFSGFGAAVGEGSTATFRVRSGGRPGFPDGTELVKFTASNAETPRSQRSPAFSRLLEATVLIKVTGQGSAGSLARLRGFVLLFQRDN